jgi:hypothetical protein
VYQNAHVPISLSPFHFVHIEHRCAFFYAPFISKAFEEIGFLRFLPIGICLIVGFVFTLRWIEDSIEGKRNASREVHNSNFPVPSVRASGWGDTLIASETSIDEAFETTKGRRDGIIGVVDEDRNQLILQWNKKGWVIELIPNGERVRKIAVKTNNKFSGKEMGVTGFLGDIFKSPSGDSFDHQTAQDVVRSFFGWGKMPHNIAWSTVIYN